MSEHMAPTPTADTTPDSTPASISSLRQTLTSESSPLAARFRALFSLKHVASSSDQQASTTLSAIDAISAAFSSPSALLKHELAYCLGQTGNLASVQILQKVLKDRDEDPMCRHEAAEALGALNDAQSLALLKERLADEKEEEVVRETCEIAIQRIEWESSAQRVAEVLKSRYAAHVFMSSSHALTFLLQ